MKEDQHQILRRIAKEKGITITQAEEVWSLFCKKIEFEICSNKRVDEVYDLNKFSVIHIDNFGKFIPNTKNIKFANLHLERAKAKNEKNLNIMKYGSKTSE